MNLEKEIKKITKCGEQNDLRSLIKSYETCNRHIDKYRSNKKEREKWSAKRKIKKDEELSNYVKLKDHIIVLLGEKDQNEIFEICVNDFISSKLMIPASKIYSSSLGDIEFEYNITGVDLIKELKIKPPINDHGALYLLYSLGRDAIKMDLIIDSSFDYPYKSEGESHFKILKLIRYYKKYILNKLDELNDTKISDELINLVKKHFSERFLDELIDISRIEISFVHGEKYTPPPHCAKCLDNISPNKEHTYNGKNLYFSVCGTCGGSSIGSFNLSVGITNFMNTWIFHNPLYGFLFADYNKKLEAEFIVSNTISGAALMFKTSAPRPKYQFADILQL